MFYIWITISSPFPCSQYFERKILEWQELQDLKALSVNRTQLPSINHLPSSLLSHGRKAVGKPLHLRSPLKWCGISIATVLACSCVCLARSGHLVGPPVGSCEPGLLLHHGTCGPNGVATALVKSSVSSSCI